MMVRSGSMTPNEIRTLEDLPPKEGNADELFISGDLYPIDLPISERNGTSSSVVEKKEEALL